MHDLVGLSKIRVSLKKLNLFLGQDWNLSSGNLIENRRLSMIQPRTRFISLEPPSLMSLFRERRSSRKIGALESSGCPKIWITRSAQPSRCFHTAVNHPTFINSRVNLSTLPYGFGGTTTLATRVWTKGTELSRISSSLMLSKLGEHKSFYCIKIHATLRDFIWARSNADHGSQRKL